MFGGPQTDSDAAVGFDVRGRRASIAEPCLFDDYCTPDDASAWYGHAMAWISEAAKHARTPEEQQKIEQLRQRTLALEEQARSCRLDCQSVTQPLVSAARLASGYAHEWSGGPIESPDPGSGWWPKLDFPIPEIEFPSGPMMLARLGPWILVGLLLFAASKRRAN